MKIEKILSERNTVWQNSKLIPKWVDLTTVGLDQYFTKKEVALWCYQMACDYLTEKGVDIRDCLFIEPSAGNGSFFNLLPCDSRIGIDLCPLSSGIIKHDFLTWSPPKTNKKIVVIGNPPFGYRAWLALEFMKKAASFADYVFFILPMAFQSEGKGSPKYRVKGLRLAKTYALPSHSFRTPQNEDYHINSLFQCWEKGKNSEFQDVCYNDFMDIFTVDSRKERLCGQEKMKDADFFIQRTFFSNPPKLVYDFSEVKYKCGYGFIIKKSKDIIQQILNDTDWMNYSNLAVHGCRHISMYHIRKALFDHGLR